MAADAATETAEAGRRAVDGAATTSATEGATEAGLRGYIPPPPPPPAPPTIRVRAICQAGDLATTASLDDTVSTLRARLFDAWPRGEGGGPRADAPPAAPGQLQVFAAGRRLGASERLLAAALPRCPGVAPPATVAASLPPVLNVHVVVRRPEAGKPGGGGGGGRGDRGGGCWGCVVQ